MSNNETSQEEVFGLKKKQLGIAASNQSQGRATLYVRLGLVSCTTYCLNWYL